MAVLDGRLYLGLGDPGLGHRQRAMLGSYDPVAGAWQVIASAASTEARNSFDARSRLHFTSMASDSTARRLIVMATLSGYPYKEDGVWTFDLATKQTQLLHAGSDMVFSDIFHGPDSSLYCFNEYRNSIWKLNLKTNEIAEFPLGPQFRDRVPRGVIDDWAWTAQPFGRINLHTGERQLFADPNGSSSSPGYALHSALPIEGGRILITFVDQMWIVELAGNQ